MPAGVAAALARRCSGLAQDARALWRTIPRLGTVGPALALCWELIEQGGIQVQTPPAPAPPLIVTTVQLDGDIMTLVDPDLFKGQSDTWMSSGQQHAAAVRAALMPLFCLPDALRGAHAALFAAITVGNLGFLASTAWSPGQLSDRALAELSGSAAIQAGVMVLWRSIRRMLFRALALGLRWRFRRMAARWRSESKSALPELKKRLAERRATHPGSEEPGT